MENRKSSPISTLYVVLLGVMSVTVLLTIYHCIVVTWCNPQRSSNPRRSTRGSAGEERAESAEHSTVELIPPAVKYDKAKVAAGEGQATCAVCLSDFNDGEAVRLLPACRHCFHAECVDMWLASHTNCPMCRTETSPMLNALRGGTIGAAVGATDASLLNVVPS